jgi:hypothetical protein
MNLAVKAGSKPNWLRWRDTVSGRVRLGSGDKEARFDGFANLQHSLLCPQEKGVVAYPAANPGKD